MQDAEFRDLPTPQPLEAADVAAEEPSLFDRLLERWKLLAGLIGLGLVVAIVAVVLWGGGGGPTDTKFAIPPSLQEVAEDYPELAALLNDPALGSVYKDFLIAYETGGIDAARELATQRGLLNDREEIRITLVVDSAEHVPALMQQLQGVGVTVEGSYKERINIGVPLGLIVQFAEEQGTDALFQQLTGMEYILRLELPTSYQSDKTSLLDEGQGVAVTGADRWHEAGYRGQSIRVGVLDLGFDGYRALLGTELPDNVVAASFAYDEEPDGSGEVHGTACAEIVYDMAPDAELFFAYYDSTLVSMGQAVDWLLSQDVHIITNSTTGVVGPMDGSDESAEMVDDAASRGVLWVNSSGNAAEEHYRGAFTDADGDGLHEFPDGTEAIGLYVGASQVTFALNWDDWRGVTEDYDLFLFDNEGELLASSEDIQNGQAGQSAAEIIVGHGVAEGVYYLAIKGDTTSRAGMLDLYTLGAALEFPVPEHSLGSPADAYGALAVGATQYADDSLASYSSQGPSNDGRLKPEMSAPAGVSSVTYSPQVFHGTSASTPHVAGAAALVWSAFPDYTADQVRDYLQSHALDLGSPGPDNAFGYGRLRLPEPPSAAVEVPVVPTALPTLAALPTAVPEATVVARLPEPVEKLPEEGASRAVSPLVVGGLGLCGGLLFLGGGGLLLLALWRSNKRPTRAVTPRRAAPPPSWEMPVERPADTTASYGALMIPGLAPIWLQPGTLSLGRAAGNDVVLDSMLVSRSHARIECGGGRCVVQDLGSANGLFVNGRRTAQAVLSSGDRLRLGDVDLVYQAGGVSRADARGETDAWGQATAWLEIGGRQVPLPAAGASLGRSQDNDVHVPDERASRHHARIDVEQGVYVISDLGSVNGTFVNRQRIQRQALRDGDEIRIGDTQLRFRSR